MRIRKLAINGVALLTFISGTAYADPIEDPTITPKKSAKTEKILRTLDTLGLNTPAVEALVHDMQYRTKDRYFRVTEHRLAGGTLKLHYEMQGVKTENLELKFQPDNSNMSFTARRKGVMANYNLQF